MTATRVLEHLHSTVGLDLWAVGRRQGDDWLVLSSQGGDLVGVQLPWLDTLCAVVDAGHAEWATLDVDKHPLLVAARARLGLPIGSFVTVQLRGEDGSLLGTLCGAGKGPSDASLFTHRAQLDLFADLLGALLSTELRFEREARSREAAEVDAHTDSLTGLGNRRRWATSMAAEEERCSRFGSTASVITIDVDGLKEINDRWGHDAGDALLQQVAGVLRRESRPGDVVVRLGGDEFAVLLAETGAEVAAVVTARLQATLFAARAAASVGFAARGREGLAGAWRTADARMYEAKRAVVRVEPMQPAPALGSSDPTSESVIRELLALARRHTGADTALIGRFDGPVRVLRAIETDLTTAIAPGHAEGLETTYCQHMISGELPSAVPDTAQHPVAMGLAATTSMPSGGFLGVPLVLDDGRVYGTVCCLSVAAQPSFDAEAVVFLKAIAGSLARVLGVEEAIRAGRRQVLSDIDDVLTRDAVRMAYQPVMDLLTGDMRGVEALARFEHGGRTTQQWFGDAAEVERGAELELRTARSALDESSAWAGELWFNMSANVLVSPAIGTLFEGRDLTRVVVEISEHEEVADYGELRRALQPWRDRGLRLAVDDAGAGFSSLRHVLELVPDVIKLDISLVRGLSSDGARRALVTALVAFAREAGMLVLGEGVESKAELEALRGTGVALAQGYYLGRPVPARVHEDLLRTRELSALEPMLVP